MNLDTMTITRLFLLAGAVGNLMAQPPPTILTIDLANLVYYENDGSDRSTFATVAGITPPRVNRNDFEDVLILADIVAVNDRPAKGLYVGRTHAILTTLTPNPGEAIADVKRTAVREQVFEILRPDGTAIGSIMSMGFSGGIVPPGAPSGQGRGGNWVIVGGTGAYLGARGQVVGWGGTKFSRGGRAASIAEDPANRRINGGGTFRFTLHIIPRSLPEIVSGASGPAIVHSSDVMTVSASKPAAAGEVLSLFASGLGPVRPSVDPGQPFPSNPPAVVNSPVEVMVSGKPAEVLGAVGLPGSVDGYQVSFRLPADTPNGAVNIQLTAAWITSSPVSIAVQ